MNNTKYTHKTYGTALAIKVSPSDRAEDVMYYLITGCLRGDRDLDGVTWEEVNKNDQ